MLRIDESVFSNAGDQAQRRRAELRTVDLGAGTLLIQLREHSDRTVRMRAFLCHGSGSQSISISKERLEVD